MLKDAETGEVFEVNTGDRRKRRAFAERRREGQTELERAPARFNPTPGLGFHTTFPPWKETDTPGRHPWFRNDEEVGPSTSFPADCSAGNGQMLKLCQKHFHIGHVSFLSYGGPADRLTG